VIVLPIAWVGITGVAAAVAMAVFGATFLGFLRLAHWPRPEPDRTARTG